ALKSPAYSIRRWKAVPATPSGGAIFPARAGCSASCSNRSRKVRLTRSSTSSACSASARRGAASRAWPFHSIAPASARRPNGRRAGRRCGYTSDSRTSTTCSGISNAALPHSPRRGETAGSAQLLARVLINAQMSGFGDEAEILCSTRALPVLTPTGHERAAFAAMHGFDRLYSAWSLGLGSSRCSGASSLACSAATPPLLLHWPHEKTDWEKNHARDRSCFAQYRNNGFAAHRR